MKLLDAIGDFFGVNKWVFVAIGASFVAGGWLGWHEYSLRLPAKLEAQKKVDAKECGKAQAITKGENDALVTARDRIAADLARYKLQHPNTCVYPSGKGQLQPSGGEHAGLHGISTDWLRDYAALCETYRSEVMVCTGQADPTPETTE